MDAELTDYVESKESNCPQIVALMIVTEDRKWPWLRAKMPLQKKATIEKATMKEKI